MSFGIRLVDTGWDHELDSALQADHSALRIVCPFIKLRTAERLLRLGVPSPLLVLTRFRGNDFYDGVSDLDALRLLLEHGAIIRGVRHLHAKLYLFGDTRALITSANLTEAALLKNLEFGCAVDEPRMLSTCLQYFNGLWQRAQHDLTLSAVDTMATRVNTALASGTPRHTVAGLPDEGEDLKLLAPPDDSYPWLESSGQAIVKFFGGMKDRWDRKKSIIDHLFASGSHWGCAYANNKPYKKVQDGTVIFIGRVVKNSRDIKIIGRCSGLQYQPVRDDASPKDIALRPSLVKRPRIIRVHSPEYVQGIVDNGVSLYDLMKHVGAPIFASTLQNSLSGTGNTDPFKAYQRSSHIELSSEGFARLNGALEAQFARHGKLQETHLRLLNLDWPT